MKAQKLTTTEEAYFVLVVTEDELRALHRALRLEASWNETMAFHRETAAEAHSAEAASHRRCRTLNRRIGGELAAEASTHRDRANQALDLQRTIRPLIPEET